MITFPLGAPAMLPGIGRLGALACTIFSQRRQDFFGLPGGGWEIAWLERSDITERLGADRPFNLNRAIIQKGETRMMVYYWFQQRERRIAWDIAAKFWLMIDGITTGRTDGALIRLTTPIGRGESDEEADARLFDALQDLMHPLPQFIPAS